VGLRQRCAICPVSFDLLDMLEAFSALSLFLFLPCCRIDMNPGSQVSSHAIIITKLSCLSPDVQSLYSKDAIVLSPHKFVGGPGTPGVLQTRYMALNMDTPIVNRCCLTAAGVLVIKKALLTNFVPSSPGEYDCFIENWMVAVDCRRRHCVLCVARQPPLPAELRGAVRQRD
jgi:hypothetical protein